VPGTRPRLADRRRAVRVAAHAVLTALTAAIYLVAVVPASRARIAARRRAGKLPAILWGPTPVVNVQYSVRADRLYGYRSDSLVYQVYGIDERDDFDYVLDRWASVPVLGLLVPYAAFLWAGFRYDVIGCFFDGGLLAGTPFWSVELPLLRLAGKKIVVYPYGGDARLPSATRARDRWNAYTDVLPGAEDRDEQDVRRHLAAFGRWANVILGNNDLVEDLPRCDGIFPYPFDTDSWPPVAAPENGPVKVVHAANHRHYKGTRFLVEAVERLRAEGLAVELEVVEGRPRTEARRTYETAHIAAADFLIGGYAYFAIESMALGKPVLSYLRPSTARLHPEWSDCPVVNASPDTLADELRRLVRDRELRAEVGRRGPEYVRRVHSLEAVGAKLDAIYRGLWGLPPSPPSGPSADERGGTAAPQEPRTQAGVGAIDVPDEQA
jgi:glycosyltransferase involved in cell wall biosynthesis